MILPPFAVPRKAQVVEASLTWNYTTWLNIVFLVLAALLTRRLMSTDGPDMLWMMNRQPNPEELMTKSRPLLTSTLQKQEDDHGIRAGVQSC